MHRFGVTSGTAGAIAELRVAVDLMQRRYHVFRALSPSCPADLVAFHDGDLAPIFIEVRTAHERNGRVYRTAVLHDGHPPGTMFAHVLLDRILYDPDLPPTSES